MQDIGSTADTELTRKDLALRWRELRVEILKHCQSIGNWIFFQRVRESGEANSIPVRSSELLPDQLQTMIQANRPFSIFTAASPYAAHSITPLAY